MDALDVNPIPLPLTDVYTALQNGCVGYRHYVVSGCGDFAISHQAEVCNRPAADLYIWIHGDRQKSHSPNCPLAIRK